MKNQTKMDNQVKIFQELLETEVNSDNESSSSEFNSNDSSGMQEETYQINIYKDVDDNPYQVIDVNTEEHIYQVLGNEIILITKDEGVCCLCQSVSMILYTDNSYGNNIPVQICKTCIDKMFV